MSRTAPAIDLIRQPSAIERLQNLRRQLARQLARGRETGDVRAELDLAAAMELEAHGIPAPLPGAAALSAARANTVVAVDDIRAELALAESLELAAHSLPSRRRLVAAG